MRELSAMEMELVGGEGAAAAFVEGAGAGGFAGAFAGGLVGAAAGALIGGVIAVGIYYI